MTELGVEIWMHLTTTQLTQSIESKLKKSRMVDFARKCQQIQDGQGQYKGTNTLVLYNPPERPWLKQGEIILAFFHWEGKWGERASIQSGQKAGRNGRLRVGFHWGCSLRCEQRTSQRQHPQREEKKTKWKTLFGRVKTNTGRLWQDISHDTHSVPFRMDGSHHCIW